MWIERFKNPDMEDRPKVRYWIPHGVMSEMGIVKDVKDIAERGFGSIEVVSMTRGLPDEFYTRDNMWGSQMWLEKINILLREAKKYGLKVDISNGPGWPIVDINIVNGDDENTLYELAYALKILEPGEQYTGVLPLPDVIYEEGTLKRIATSLYRINPVGDKVLDYETYIALPVEDKIDVTAPKDGRYALFVFYGRPSMQKYGEFYVMDHFSEKATDSVMDFWENTILPALSENADVLENIFCDSLEYRVDLEWTRSFETDFENRKGYSIIPYLPCLGCETMSMPTNGTYFCREDVVYFPSRNESVYPKTNICCYTFSDKTLSHKVNNDFFEMITYLYCEKHVKRMQDRAEKMGLGIRYQVSYGKTLESECAALYPAIPEHESLGGGMFDLYRTMSGAVHLSRKKIYSFECAAEGFNSYGQTHEDILWWMKRAYVCGINLGVMHGAHYCGYYNGEGNEGGLGPGINWPGFEGFTRRTWTNAWNRTLDKVGQKSVWDYMARVNFLLRNVQKVDVAIFSQTYHNCREGKADGRFIFSDGGWLNKNGYTYEFLTPKLLQHENCKVNNGVLDSQGSSYKAIVVNEEEYIDYESAQNLKAFADSGLPVIFIGKIPSRCNMYSEKYTDIELSAFMKTISCHFITTPHALPEKLRELNILPDMMPDKPAFLFPVHVKVENCDFYYVYNGNLVDFSNPFTSYPMIDKKNEMNQFKGKLSLLGKGTVYEIDGFTGKITQLQSEQIENRVEFGIDIVRDEAKIFAVLSMEAANKLGIYGEKQGEYSLVEERRLRDFSLDVTEILPPEDQKGTFYESRYCKKECFKLNKLKSWREIEGLYRTCGIGVYKTVFSIDSLPGKAILSLENVVDTYHIKVNGVELPFTDPAVRQNDITAALKNGENVLEITVYTTIQNIASLDFLLAEGKKKRPQEVGIWGEVTLKLFS